MSQPRLTLVLGGARSGKSRHAENLISAHPAPWTYIATAEAFDDEMRARIGEHQARRDANWRTVDAPLALPGALAATQGPVLVDCLTLWLTNLMLGGHDLKSAFLRLQESLGATSGSVVMVSNESVFPSCLTTPWAAPSATSRAGSINRSQPSPTR